MLKRVKPPAIKPGERPEAFTERFQAFMGTFRSITRKTDTVKVLTEFNDAVSSHRLKVELLDDPSLTEIRYRVVKK